MPRVGLEPTTPAFERAKLVHALDRAATGIGVYSAYYKEVTYVLRAWTTHGLA
jgi:hypothetical protein